MATHLSRRIAFSSAHRYYQKAFSDEKNREVFGKCFNPHGHGHNYILEITLSGTVDSQTGMVMNLVEVDKILKDVTDPFDHHHINFDVPAFKDQVPTTENLSRYFYGQVLEKLPSQVKLTRVRLYENDELWADHYGP